jgi:hypothetical protein
VSRETSHLEPSVIAWNCLGTRHVQHHLLAINSVCVLPLIFDVFSWFFLDINGLVGNSLPVQIPQVVVKWITYLLFLHVVALAAAAGSALFGLLAHVREMSMTCCSVCFSGFAAVVTLIAFIFDIVLFFVAKARINAIGSAQIGNAIWLTLAAWLLLFFSGCFFTLGRCCMRGRPSHSGGGGRDWFGRRDASAGSPHKNYADEMRLDAVKAEADRKARQKQGEGGLPAFYETQPLTGHVEGDRVYLEGEHNQSKSDLPSPSPARQQSTNFKGGYSPGPTGTRTVDDYYRNSPASTGYPPQRAVHRQQSEHSAYSVPTTTASPTTGYAQPSGYGQYNNVPMSTSPPPPNNQLLGTPGHQSYSDPYGREYGHTAGGTSCKYSGSCYFICLTNSSPDHTAISHDQGPSSYAQPMSDPYAAYKPHQSQPHLSQSPYHPDPYMPTFTSHTPLAQISTDYYRPTSTVSPPPIQQPQPLHGDRSYTLGGDGYGTGGDGYGDNQLPPLPEHAPSPPIGAGAPSYLSPIDTNVGTGYVTGQSFQTSPVRAPMPGPNEAPPGYEPGVMGGADATANWGKR